MGAIVVAVALGILLAFFADDTILKETASPMHYHDYSSDSFWKKFIWHLFMLLTSFLMQVGI
ncbi:hypothetical protein ABG812_01250 [Streptococcus iniae]